MAKEISSSDLVPFHFPLRYMALVTKVKSPDEATAWTRALIFGVPTEYGRKRSSQSARWLKYREDITLNNLTTAAFQSALVTCLPLIESRMSEVMQGNNSNGSGNDVDDPPEMVDIQDLLHFICVEEYDTFFREYFKQTTIIAIRKSFELAVRSYMHEKIANRFCREFYPKLRRTVNRYAYNFTTYQKVYMSSLYLSTTLHLPVLLYEICVDTHKNWGYLLYTKENDRKTKVSSKATVMYLTKKMKKLVYFVIRDALVRTVITLPIFDGLLCSNQPTHEIATFMLQLLSDSMLVSILQIQR